MDVLDEHVHGVGHVEQLGAGVAAAGERAGDHLVPPGTAVPVDDPRPGAGDHQVLRIPDVDAVLELVVRVTVSGPHVLVELKGERAVEDDRVVHQVLGLDSTHQGEIGTSRHNEGVAGGQRSKGLVERAEVGPSIAVGARDSAIVQRAGQGWG